MNRHAEIRRRIARVAAVVAGSRFCAGCATVNVWHESYRTVCEVTDSSWYLLDAIPLGTGDLECPNRCSFTPFRDGVNKTNNLSLVEWARVREGASSVGITHDRWDVDHVVPYVIKRYSLHTAAELRYDGDRWSTAPVPVHECIGARERRIFK